MNDKLIMFLFGWLLLKNIVLFIIFLDKKWSFWYYF